MKTIKISTPASLETLRVPDDQPVVLSAQFASPQGCCDEMLRAVDTVLSREPQAAGSPGIVSVVQAGRRVPKSLLSDLDSLPALLLRPPTESDLIVMPPRYAKMMQTSRCDQRSLNQQLLNWAANGELTCCGVESTPFSGIDLPGPGPDVPAGTVDGIEGLLFQSLQKIRPSEMDSDCIRSGILLLWNLLDDSHSISQTMEGRGRPRTGDYWHGIMHRREPDPGNAAYWFRRVGAHPAYDQLIRNLRDWLIEQQTPNAEMQILESEILRGRRWDPLRMIEFSQQAIRQPGSPVDLAFRRVQYLEMLNLLAFSIVEGTST